MRFNNFLQEDQMDSINSRHDQLVAQKASLQKAIKATKDPERKLSLKTQIERINNTLLQLAKRKLSVSTQMEK